MLNNFARYTPGQDLGGAFSSERLALAGEMILVGMGMIFAVLVILWAVLAVFKLVFAGNESGKKTPATVAKTETPAPEPVAEAAGDDDELIAVITAAVAAYRAAEEPTAAENGFRVVSFRRANGGRAWNSK